MTTTLRQKARPGTLRMRITMLMRKSCFVSVGRSTMGGEVAVGAAGRRADARRFMIQCEACEDWFHPGCVRLPKKIAQQLSQDSQPYFCPACVRKLC